MRLMCLLMLVGSLVLTAPAWGQEQPPRALTSSEPLTEEEGGAALQAPRPARAETEADARLPVLERAGAMAGLARYRPGHWAMAGMGLHNPADHPVTVVVASYVAGYPDRQMAREVWLPARSHRETWAPIWIPEELDEQRMGVDVETLLLLRQGERETLIPDPGGRRTHLSRLPIYRAGPVTALLSDPQREEEAEQTAAYEAVVAFRIARGWDRGLALLSDPFLPPTPEMLDALDHLVVRGGDRLGEDVAGARAIRRWVERGGRLWIMLDQVPDTTWQRLVGDAIDCEVVDRVDRALVPFHAGSALGAGRLELPEEPLELVDTVPLVRVLVSGVDVLHQVDGWPASFRFPLGEGQVVVTTLGAEAWVQPREASPFDATARGMLRASDFEPNVAGEQLAAIVFDTPPESTLAVSQWQSYLAAHVGYQIPSRRQVAGTLGLFCIGLVGIGVWLSWTERLERIALWGPALALLAALVVGVLGWQSRQAVLPTLATAQLVRIVPGSQQAESEGMLGIYVPDTRGVGWEVHGTGRYELDLADLAGTMRRQVWTDLDRWHWHQLRLPPGLRYGRFRETISLESPWHARGQLGPDGLVGSLEGSSLEPLSDLVLVGPPTHALAVQAVDAHRWRATTPLAPGQFVDEALLSDEQRRRQSILRQLVRVDRLLRFPQQPTLLAWGPPAEMHLALDEEFQRRGATLWMIPLELEATPPDTPVRIPAALIEAELLREEGSGLGSSAFASQSGVWAGPLEASTQTRLRFQIPEAVLPVRLERATLTLAISAPGRRLEVAARQGDQWQLVERHDNPQGRLSMRIDDPQLLELDRRGGLALEFSISAPVSPEAPGMLGPSPPWTIEQMEFEAEGRTEAVAAPTTPEQGERQ